MTTTAPESPDDKPKRSRSYELAANWREDARLEYWREEVRKRAAAQLAENPKAFRALEIRAPEIAAEALYLLACTGMGKQKIARELGIDARELWRLELHHGTLELRRAGLAARMTNLSGGLMRILEQKVDQLEDDPEKLSATSLKDITLSIGISLDKAAMLSGMPTTVIEHRTGPTIEDAQREIQAARDRLAERAKVQCIDAEIVEPVSSVPDSDDY